MVVVFRDLHSERDIGVSLVSDLCPLLRHGLSQVGEGFLNFHQVIGSVAALARRLLELTEIHLCFNKVGLKVRPHFVFDRMSRLKILLIFTGLSYKPVCDADEMVFCEWTSPLCHKIHSLIGPLNETLEGFLCVIWQAEANIFFTMPISDMQD